MKTKLQKSKVPEGYNWTTEYDNGLESFDSKDLIAHLEPEQEESSIKGTTLAEILKEKSFNSATLDYLLEHQNLIPEEWKRYYGVFFWGTIFRDGNGSLCVRGLYWDGGEWGWRCGWLDGGWDDGDPAAVRASVLNLNTKPLLKPSPLTCPHCKKELKIEIK